MQVASIEAYFDKQSIHWRRLLPADLDARFQKYAFGRLRAGWSIRLAPGSVSHPGVTHLEVLIDHTFPYSQPRIVARGAQESDKNWPHVEGDGLLCLGSTHPGSDAGDRVSELLSQAVALLNYSEEDRTREFKRECASYWDRSSSTSLLTMHSLVSPDGPSRQIYYVKIPKESKFVFSDNREQLNLWLTNSGNRISEKQIQESYLIQLEQPLVPSEFPKIGRDVLSLISDDWLSRKRIIQTPAPIIFGAKTETGPVLGAVLLNTAPISQLRAGFRENHHYFRKRVMNSMLATEVQRYPVHRIDGKYVHGRDSDPKYQALANMRVAVIGCGALGGYIARNLAQAGVGNFVLVDHDKLQSHNTSRHILGYRFVGKNKAEALSLMLLEDFPTIKSAKQIKLSVANLGKKQVEELTNCDLVISCGIDFRGDFLINKWRLDTPQFPPHLCTWTEAFALAGHAIIVFKNDDLLAAFDSNGHPLIELTKWGEETDYLITEAGCGNTFQPHGVIDLQRTVTLASKLALDNLQGHQRFSTHRTWQGDRDQVLDLKGTPSADFVESNCERTKPWPPKGAIVA